MDESSSDQDRQQQAQNKNKKQGGKGQEGNKGQRNNNNNSRPQNQNQQGHQGGNKLQKTNVKIQPKQESDSSDAQLEQKPPAKVQSEKKPAENQPEQAPKQEITSNSSVDNQEQPKVQKKQQRQNQKNEQKGEGQSKQHDNKEKQDGGKQGVCRLYKAGKCFYGDKCKFSHGKVKVGLEKLCKLFLDQGKCKYDTKCHFVHMTKEEWELKYRYHKQESEKVIVKDSSSDDDDVPEEEKDNFEYKSKNQLKKEKAKRLADEHKAHKDYVQNNDKNTNKTNITFTTSQPVQVKDTKVPGVEYFDPDDFGREHSNEQVIEEPKQEEKKEKPGFDLVMIEAMKQKQLKKDGKEQEIVNSRKFKPWVDVSRTDQGKLTADLNNQLLFKNDYAGFVKSLNDNYSRDLGQIMRQYMSSFKWIQKNHMFEIFFTPTCKKENLPINFDINEGHFRFRIALDPKGAGANTQYQVLNTSIPEEITDSLDELLNNIHQAQGKSIFRTLKYFDNNLEKVFKGAHDLIELQKEKEREEERLKQEEEERQRQLELKKLEGGDEQNEEDGEEDEEGDEDYGDEEYDEVEDPYFNQNDDENNEDSNEDEPEEEEKKDPTADLDLNMHCSLKDLQMRRIAHLRVQSLVVSVKCKSCKYDTELTLSNYLEGSGENVLVNNLICVSCNRMAAIFCSREFICGPDLNLAFRIGSHTWHILDIRQVSYNVTCEGCNSTKVVDNYVTGTNHSSDCHSCFKNLSFQYFSFNIEKKIDQEYLERMRKNAANKKKLAPTISVRPKKIGTFKQGEPLPKNGTCSHYRHSYRLFRFPCCGKAFACDLCHDQAEKHEQIKAKSMICGFCSREQSIKQECNGCKKMLVRINSNSGYWEGGKGTRNQASMSSRDNHKFSGLNKTISRRKIKKENMQKK